MERKQYIIHLFDKYLAGQCSRSEMDELFSYFNTKEENATLMSLIVENLRKEQKSLEEDVDILSIAQNAGIKIFTKTRPKPFLATSFAKIAIAAIIFTALAVLLIIGIGLKKDGVKTYTDSKISIPAGTDRAILTLGDGRTVALGNNVGGELAVENGVSIKQAAKGQLTYRTAIINKQNQKKQQNRLEVPNGGQFSVSLADGTIVWLNAGSTLKYPSTFEGHDKRIVELSGEAYFEVAKNHKIPFIVKTEKQIIEVLGTHFNVNSYADELIATTTLVEGKVRVEPGNKPDNSEALILAPGEQAAELNGNLKLQKADLESALAWKNGMIYFKKASIQSIMRQVSRWYDIEVEYKGTIPNRQFTGGVYRNANLSEILKILILNNIHFKLVESKDGKKLIVEP